ncbi:argonaute-like protein [Mycena polygramma]|nr:argonaute-like protein [Mycena polygramma]
MPPRPAPAGARVRLFLSLFSYLFAESTAFQVGLPTSGAHITTVGVKRPDFSSGGQPVNIYVNSFETTVPSSIIYHYDVVISPSEKTLPARMTMDLIRRLQFDVAPQIFTPRCVYDGRKNIFSIQKLPFDTGSQEFDVTLADATSSTSGKGPKVYKIKLTLVAQINPEVLKRFIAGDQSHDNTVLTAITALNVVIRMEPTLNYPFNVRSFFTNRETKDIGAGLELCKSHAFFDRFSSSLTYRPGRGYFQSIRPAMGKIRRHLHWHHGPLLRLCLEYIGKNDPNALSPKRGFPDRERLRLQRFIGGIRVLTTHAGPNGEVQTPRVIKKLSTAGASSLTFQMREGQTMTVAEYFQSTQNKPLQFPDVICCEVGSGALIPLELCVVPPGQLMRKQVPPEKTKDVLDFATKKPADRLKSIVNGLQVLAYGQSEYVRQFGMDVKATGPLQVQARVLKPPMLKYGAGSRQLTITPRDGAWNMVDKKFFKPVAIDRWVVVVYEQQRRFNEGAANDMINGLCGSCRDVGIKLAPTPFIFWENGQGRISDQLKAAGAACAAKTGKGPNLMVVILPELLALTEHFQGGNDIYTSVKHFGDITMGVATQCLKSSKCFRAKPQYYANVCLKINVKLGGINTIPGEINTELVPDRPLVRQRLDRPTQPYHRNGRSVFLSPPLWVTDEPTFYQLPADVIHPAPGSDGRPSFTALVANVDSDTAKYIAASRVQTSRQEMIEELESMSHHCLSMYMRYREMAERKAAGTTAPKRIIFYRDGVSEGQFKQVLEQEACASLKIDPKITILVVGKRHHVRFFPQSERDADRSGNCRAGTVVDRDVAHPTEFDFYLQAHGGLLGTSRPAHYSVLYDENNFSADALQSLSFALCHVYARSTRSVSIPAPVYYADIVCSRAKNHYDPQGTVDFSDSATQVDEGQAASTLEAFKRGFKPLHASQSTLMYFRPSKARFDPCLDVITRSELSLPAAMSSSEFRLPGFLLAAARIPLVAVGLPLGLGLLSGYPTAKVVRSDWYKTGYALVDSVIMAGATFYMTKLLASSSPTAAYLLLPYCAWLSFATYLNGGIWWLNRGTHGPGPGKQE